MANKNKKQQTELDKIVSLCKRRGFIFQSSEIYGGLNGAYDYGPLGVQLKNNIRDIWWKEMTQMHDDIVGIDASILMASKVWEASGHVGNFSDPMVDCKECKARFRADQIDLDAACPNCGEADSFTEPKNFNLMFQTSIGADSDTASVVYLRPETAQGIYVNFRNVVDSSRVQIPFGIAQVGKSFRNEITTKNFIFRSCEFEQMEMQFFCKPGDDEKWFPYWREQRMAFYEKMGIRMDHLRWHQHGPKELAFYAKDAYDIEYQFVEPMQWQELEGVHSRTDYDLTQHSKFCGKQQDYLDPVTHERYIPYVVETSAGLTRNVLMALCDAYDEEILHTEKGDDLRTVLHFHPRLAPVTVAVLPLVKKDGIAELAKEIEMELREEFTTFYDKGGAIGRRYRRMDEIGTPYCVTVDYDTKEDNTVTLRFRDSMEQVRVPVSELISTIKAATKNYKRK
jgi:glycyl-tRNA synthetase